ncbi:MAG: hypothetical protein RLZZ298_1720 [Pseudomonadota bacterium]|jgi:integrase
MRHRKYSFPTIIPFTVDRLRKEAARIRALGLVQVQFTCETDPGLQAMIYGASGRIVFYSRYSRFRRPYRVKLGEFGLISIDQAKHQHRANRVLAAQGRDPRQPKTRPMLFKQLFLDHYVVQCQSRGKKTLHTDRSRQMHWIGPEFDHMAVEDITKTHISHFILKMLDGGLKPATIKTTIGQLRSTLEIGVELDVIARNPAKGVRTPRVDNRRTEFMTVTQVQSFMTVAQASEDIVGSRMLMLMAYTAARLGEATAGEWAHISLDEGIWDLPTQKSGRRGQIYLCQAARRLILELVAFRRNEFLFPGAKGNAQRSRPIKLFHRLCEQAGIPKTFRIHDLRHAWCSLGTLAGIPLEIISLAARHSSPTVTRIYSHAHWESLVAANETIADLITPRLAA